MKMIYTDENAFLTSNIKNLLEAQNIAVFVKNEYSQGAVGEISAFDAWPQVWVLHDVDYERAVDIVALSKARVGGTDWQCPTCNEENDASFELCWNCQREHVPIGRRE
jgi:peptide subunit release factor 1 (eRF1)